MRRSYRSPSKARIPALLVLSVALACGYSFRSPVPAHLDTLYVLTFENETREFQLTQQLTERVVNEFLNESRLRLVGDEEDADLVVLGTIKDYEEEALSYDPRQGANPDVFTRRVLLTVDVSYDDGQSWRRAPLVRTGQGWLARLVHPESGFVSLRAKAVDAHGNSVEQTIIRGYRLR